MPVSKKTEQKYEASNPQSPSAVAYYKRSSKDIAQYPTKRVLNLCMKEKSNMSAEAFLGILAAILVVVLLLEFFGVYRPYKNVEDLEAAYYQREAAYNELREKLKDYDNIREQYNRYNYENFDFSIADRNDVLELLDKRIFPYATVSYISLSDNKLILSLEDVDWDNIITIRDSLKEDPIFVSSEESQISFDENHVSKYRITINIIAKNTTGEGTNNG